MKTLIKLITVVLLLSIIGCKSNYEKGVELVKEKKYDLAVECFKEVKWEDENYSFALSKIDYISGLKYYEIGQYEKALTSLSVVLIKDEYKKSTDSLIILIKNEPKYIFKVGQQEFNAGRYYYAFTEFNRLPVTSEEYNLCKSKLIICQAYIFRKEDKLDTALNMLQSIEATDPYYSLAQSEIKSVENKIEFVKAKDLYKEQKYDEALKLLQMVDKKDDYYREAKELISKIDQLIVFNKYPKIKQIEYKSENAMLYINGNIKLPVQKTDWMVINFDKFSEKNTFKEILPYNNYYYKNFKKDGGLNPKYGEVMGIFEVMINKEYQLMIFNWKDFIINDDKLRNKMSNSPSDYKICFVYKIDHITNNIGLFNVYSKDLYFYILDDNDDILYKSEEKEK